MATGERTFSSQGRQVKKFDNTPVTPGKYTGTFDFTGWKIAKGQGAGKLPRLSGPIELFDTGVNGGKNRKMFHDFYLDTTPSPKDGTSMVERGGGLIDFARCVGAEVEGIHLERMKKIDDDGAESMRDVLNPQEALRWLKQFEGVPFGLQVKIEKGTAGYEDRNRVSYFIEGEASEGTEETEEDMEFETDAAPETETMETAADDELPEEEAEWTEEEVETTPAPTTTRRSPVQKPAMKTATKNGVAKKTAAIANAKKPVGRTQARR